MLVVITAALSLLFVAGIAALIVGARDEEERRLADEVSRKTKECSEYIKEVAEKGSRIDKKV
jgi:protein-S-isoprenylcysteine O-methyltransferase Ste14